MWTQVWSLSRPLLGDLWAIHAEHTLAFPTVICHVYCRLGGIAKDLLGNLRELLGLVFQTRFPKFCLGIPLQFVRVAFFWLYSQRSTWEFFAISGFFQARFPEFSFGLWDHFGDCWVGFFVLDPKGILWDCWVGGIVQAKFPKFCLGTPFGIVGWHFSDSYHVARWCRMSLIVSLSATVARLLLRLYCWKLIPLLSSVSSLCYRC